MSSFIKKSFSQAVFDFFALLSSHALGTFFNIGINLSVTKFLVPADYGIIATLLFLFSLGGWLFDWGAEQALLATDENNFYNACQTHAGLRSVTALTVAAAAMFYILTFSSSNKTILNSLELLCLGFVCEKLASTYKIILEKTGKLKTLALLEFSISSVSAVAVLILAIQGFGAVALAAGNFLQRGLLLVGYAWRVGKFITPVFKPKKFYSLLQTFGIANFIAASFGLVIYDFMPFLIGRIAGLTQAGLYARAFSIATMPLIASAIFGRIFNTVCAQNLFNFTELSRWFCLLQVSKGLLIIPGQLFLLATSPWWSAILFTESQWQGFLPVYTALALYGLARAFYDDVTCSISIGFKNPWVFTFAQALHALLILTLAPVAIAYGNALGGAACMAASMLLVALLFWRKIFHFLGLETRSFLRLGSSTLYKTFTKFIAQK